MKIPFAVISVVSILIVSCNQNYPSQVSENGLEGLYDTAKWVVYCSNHRSEKIICHNLDENDLRNGVLTFTGSDKVSNDNIVSSTLLLEDLKIETDTTVFIFRLFFTDSLQYCIPYNGFVSTVIFIRNDEFIYRTGEFGYDSDYLKIQKEIANSDSLKKIYRDNGFVPLEEENQSFIQYLQTTNKEINPWLKNEARKRGILVK